MQSKKTADITLKISKKITRKWLFLSTIMGIIAINIFLLLSLLVLKQNSSLGMLYAHVSNAHFILYCTLTVATGIIFGAQTAFFSYQIQKYGFRNILQQSGSGGGTGIGAVLAVFSASCPVCGATALSFFGIAGGFSTLPLQGLELKTLSFLVILASSIFTLWQLRKKTTANISCPLPNNTLSARYNISFVFYGIILVVTTFLLTWLIITDIQNFSYDSQSAQSCPTEIKY